VTNKKRQPRPLFVSVFDNEQEARARAKQIKKNRKRLLEGLKRKEDGKQ